MGAGDMNMTFYTSRANSFAFSQRLVHEKNVEMLYFLLSKLTITAYYQKYSKSSSGYAGVSLSLAKSEMN